MSESKIVDRIREVFQEHRDRAFVIGAMTNRVWTYGEFYDWGLRAASLLRSHGVGKGDRVALLLANSAEFAALYFGCLFIGAVAVPINQAIHPHDVAYILETSGAQLLVFSRCTRPFLLQATEKLPTLRQVRVALEQEVSFHPEDVEQAWSYNEAKIDESITPFAGVADDDTLIVLFTSGTSGKPKGVVHSVRSEFGNAIAFNTMMQFGPENRFLHIWPMSYSSGYLNALMSPFMAGASVVLCAAFTAQTILTFWRPALEHQANTLWLSPTMMASLLRLDRDEAGIAYCRSHVRAVCVGTAPLALKLKKDFEAKYGVTCLESYGLSELLILTTNSPGYPQKENSVGRLLPGVELAVAGADGERLPEGENGQLLIRTPYRMVGYLNADTRAVDAEDPGNWFPTGDIGFIDLAGDVFITGREKDLIIRGGQNISPRAIRDVLLAHPAVDDAAVVGIPHDFFGEEIAAALKLKPGFTFAEEQTSILHHCRKQLAQAAVPTKFKQVGELPMGSTGKVLNREVKVLFLATT